MQSSIPSEEIASLQATIIGMCSMQEVAMLISDMSGHDGKLYEVFEFRDPAEPAQLQWSGEVMEVWGFKVRTLYDAVNGILPGSEFDIFAFSFPDTTPRGGICRSYGTGDCENNLDKKPEDYAPLMSLLIGRGEVPELRIASEYLLDDMTALAVDLGLTEAQTASTLFFGEAIFGMIEKGKVFGFYFFSAIGAGCLIYVVFHSIVKMVKKKNNEFTPIATGP